MAHGVELPHGFMSQQQVTMTPMNDVQVTAMLAAMILPHLPQMALTAEAVDIAIDLLAESVLRAKTGRLMERVRELEVSRGSVTTDA